MMEIKVLPFECKRGKVPGHALNVAVLNGSHVSHVIVWHFDEVAQCGIEVLVPVHDWTRYQHRKYPAAGEVRAVMLKCGLRMHAKAIYATHYGETAWKAAPILCTGTIAVQGLTTGVTLVEVEGAMAWAYSPRQPEDAQLLLDPWKRDNELFDARMKEAREQERQTC